MTDVDATRSPGSTVVASEFDDPMTTASSPARADRASSARNLADPIDSAQGTPNPSKRSNGNYSDDDEVNTPRDSGTVTTGKKGQGKEKKERNSGWGMGQQKLLKHLKKEDGEPLWRKDIQHDFLKYIFEDKNKVFTNSYAPDGPKQTFAEIYIDAMARSSKTSKILRDKLWTDHEQAKNMAMVCLLVNIGRMNTTLNFFPEMRAQLRTYHAIPSLQANQDRDSYKQLQDAPRLKSILKGASEDRPEPTSLEKIKQAEIPRTNPVNLIFILTSSAQKVTELHFERPREFHDLIMRTELTSKTRATAFLWLIWHYLESDFTVEGAEENPFGAGVDYDQGAKNQGVPKLIWMTPEEEQKENVDTEEELDYGRVKMLERKRIIAADQLAIAQDIGTAKRKPSRIGPVKDLEESPSLISRIRPSKYESDIDSTRSTPPRGATKMRGTGTGKGRGLKHQVDASSPAPAGYSHIIMQTNEGSQRRTRPLTAHQLAVEQNRNQRVNYILGRGMRKKFHQSRKLRRQEGAMVRALNRMKHIADPFEDSESEESFLKPAVKFYERGFGGLVQNSREDDEFGEEFAYYAATFRRLGRRLDRWDPPKRRDLESAGDGPGDAVGGDAAVRNGNGARKANGFGSNPDDESEDELAIPKQRPTKRKKKAPTTTPAKVAKDDEEDLDDMDKEILGLGSENEDEEDEDLDDVEKALLDMRGDETEDASEDDAMDID